MSSVRSSPIFSFKNRPLTQQACLLLLACGRLASGAEPAVFTPPQAYPASRYEAGWSKNPFTLKTVAPITAQDTFARDLAIGAHYGDAENPTVVIVNTKTHERILLRKDQPAPGGMSLKSVQLSSRRSECQVEVLQGTEAATLSYDATYLSQIAVGEAGRMAGAKASAATPAHGLRLPAPPAAKSPAPPAFKVSNLEPPVPITPAPPVQNRLVLPPPAR